MASSWSLVDQDEMAEVARMMDEDKPLSSDDDIDAILDGRPPPPARPSAAHSDADAKKPPRRSYARAAPSEAFAARAGETFAALDKMIPPLSSEPDDIGPAFARRGDAPPRAAADSMDLVEARADEPVEWNAGSERAGSESERSGDGGGDSESAAADDLGGDELDEDMAEWSSHTAAWARAGSDSDEGDAAVRGDTDLDCSEPGARGAFKRIAPPADATAGDASEVAALGKRVRPAAGCPTASLATTAAPPRTGYALYTCGGADDTSELSNRAALQHVLELLARKRDAPATRLPAAPVEATKSVRTCVASPVVRLLHLESAEGDSLH